VPSYLPNIKPELVGGFAAPPILVLYGDDIPTILFNVA
jgi:hypothetical protein